jgi:hypothetical protein
LPAPEVASSLHAISDADAMGADPTGFRRVATARRRPRWSTVVHPPSMKNRSKTYDFADSVV